LLILTQTSKINCDFCHINNWSEPCTSKIKWEHSFPNLCSLDSYWFMEAHSTFTNSDLSGVIEQAQRFDLHALGQVFEIFFPQIYRYSAFRLGDGLATSELCNLVFARLLEALKQQPKAIGDMQTWLFATTQIQVEQYLTQPGAQHTSESAALPGGEAAWLGRLVRASLQRLIPEQQHLLALRFGCAFTLEETARLMRRNVSEVKSMQMEALTGVRLLMEKEA
jgi:DNA-directed RNA polymerase specialized sigma24 family protein